MITGYNTNVRHGGRLYHVQTEDSGRNNPHVISHVYIGGTILASEKREYKDLLDADDLQGAVRSLMEEQHKGMVERLKRGELDAVIAERLASDQTDPDAVASEQDAAGAEDGARSFGDGIVSEKPLDEVILDYLVKKARSRSGRSSRSE